VAHCGERPGFTLEPSQPLVIGRERRRQNLDGHVAAEARVARTIHLAHGARAELTNHFERAEPLADHRGDATRVSRRPPDRVASALGWATQLLM
jgi:hypothetical protein